MKIQSTLQKLAEQLNLTSPDDAPEPYILTKDEEDRLLANLIIDAKKQAVWKMNELGMLDNQIETKLAEIDWEKDINKEEVFHRANMVKNHELWQKEQRIKEKEAEKKKQKELAEQWTAKRMYQQMAWTSQNEFGKKLIVNSDNKHLITALCYFVSRDEKFETELGYSLNKGLLIRGVSGLGKTYLVRCISENVLNPILVLSMIEISDEIQANGEYHIKGEGKKIIYMDDVGTEQPTINHYGTKITWFKNFIETIYLKNKCFNHLIVSTNNNFSELEDKYGFRVRSRIKDMFNIIDVSGKDMRG